MTDVLIRLRQRLPQMTPTERQIAEQILDNPAIVVESTITNLAQNLDTSPGSVARMCRSVGFSGYRDFRIDMAATLGRAQNDHSILRVSEAEIEADDPVENMIKKVAYQEIRAIQDTAKALHPGTLDKAARAIYSAAQADIFGAGSSGLIAQDLQQKLRRIGIVAFSWLDIHTALTSVTITAPGGIALGISHTGTTRETLDFLLSAQDRGAQTIAITNFPDSPLGRAADLVLTTSSHESGIRVGAMASRIAQMAIVDFILVRLVQLDLPRAEEHLRRSHSTLERFRSAREG